MSVSEIGRKRKANEEDTEEVKENETVTDFTKKTWMSDVEFVVEGRSIYASKAVLGLCSPVFRAMFSSGFKEKNQSKVSLPDKKYTDFLEFLKCLYPYVSREINEENVAAILPLANEYDVRSLVKKCEEYLLSKLKTCQKTEALISTLSLVHRCNITSIEDVIILKLAKRDPRKFNIFCNDEEMGRAIPTAKLNQILISKHDQIMKLQTDFVHMSFYADNYRNVNLKKVDGFEDSQGGIIECTVSNVSYVGIEYQSSVQSDSIWIWGFHFFLRSYRNKNVNNLGFELVCETETKSEDTEWSCTVKANFVLKNHLKNGKYNRIQTYTYHEGSEKMQWHVKLSSLLSQSAGFVKDDRLETAVYFLVNKPVTNKKHD